MLLDVWVGVLVHGEPAGGVLHEQDTDAVPGGQVRPHVRSDVDHLLAFAGLYGYPVHQRPFYRGTANSGMRID